MTTTEAPISSALAPAPTGPSAADAAARLNALTSDKAWGAKYMNGDPTARRELDDLCAAVAKGDAVKDALDGKEAASEPFAVQTIVDGELPPGLMRAAVADLQLKGLTDQAIAEVMSGKTFTVAEVRAAEQWRDRAMRDPLFRSAYLKGDPNLGRQMLVANAIIAGGIAP